MIFGLALAADEVAIKMSMPIFLLFYDSNANHMFLEERSLETTVYPLFLTSFQLTALSVERASRRDLYIPMQHPPWRPSFVLLEARNVSPLVESSAGSVRLCLGSTLVSLSSFQLMALCVERASRKDLCIPMQHPPWRPSFVLLEARNVSPMVESSVSPIAC